MMRVMKWRTTLSGIVAALGQALGATGALPPPWGVVAQLVAAGALAVLGYAVADRAALPKSVK